MLSFLRYAAVCSIILFFAETGWQLDQVGLANWFDAKVLKTAKGWNSIRGDHPRVSKSPLGIHYVVRTDAGVYTTNWTVDASVADDLDRLLHRK